MISFIKRKISINVFSNCETSKSKVNNKYDISHYLVERKFLNDIYMKRMSYLYEE